MIKDTLDPPAYEEPTQQSLNGLQQQIEVYEVAQRRGDDRVTEEEVQKVAAAMRNVGDSQTDPKVKAEWYKKADKLTRSDKSTRHRLLKDVKKLVLCLVTIPCSVVGIALSFAGGILRTVGSVLSGAGDVLRGRELESSKITTMISR